MDEDVKTVEADLVGKVRCAGGRAGGGGMLDGFSWAGLERVMPASSCASKRRVRSRHIPPHDQVYGGYPKGCALL